MRLAIAAFVLASLAAPAARADDEADLKPDLKAVEKRFEVVKQRYDPDKRRYVLVLKAKETSAEACHFDASFRDADDKEVKAVKVEFEDGGKQTAKGEKYSATVKYPTRKQMERVTQIVLTKTD